MSKENVTTKVAILTVSDKGAKGERKDRSGPAIEQLIKKIKAEVVTYDIVPDEKGLIKRKLIALSKVADLILTTGGTGVSPRDVTPDATRQVIQYEIPGIAEAMRQEGMKVTPYAMLSRSIAGVREKTLIINLPGSPHAVKENLTVLLDCLPHAIEKIKGIMDECAPLGSRKLRETCRK